MLKFLGLLIFVSLSSLPARADIFGDIQPPTQVTPLIWRSGRPTLETLTALKAKGLRGIIDLEDDDDAIAAESQMAKQLGLIFVSYPMSGFWAPDDAQVNKIESVLAKLKVPVLVHCLHGEDRTGLVIGLERVMNQKWKPADAYTEMLDKGFHQYLLGLDEYFREKTGSL